MRAVTSGNRTPGRQAPLVAVVVLGLLVSVPVMAQVRCPGCAAARGTNGWCDVCGVGYVGDVPIRSRHLWHVLDAHGHRLNVANLGCDRCAAAARVDGYCAESKVGFVRGEAYFSRLTWLLAGAERQDPHELPCSVCRENAAASGWCDRCGVGRVGRYALDDRTDFENLLHDLEILALANRAAERCEHCAVAIVTDTQCPVCRIRYEGGSPLDAPREASSGAP